jgi:SAM-dependent methyltransferase
MIAASKSLRLASISAKQAVIDIGQQPEEAVISPNNFLRSYLNVAPAALALERAIECEIHCRNEWPEPVLDIGCGDGIFVRMLRRKQISTGIDPDASEIVCAQNAGVYRELIACFGNNIPKPDESYRTIFSNSVLEHIPDLVPVLKEAHRLLADEGRFYVTVPSDRLELATAPARFLSAIGFRSLAQRYGKFYNRFWRHYHAYDDEGWRDLFTAAGFDVVEHIAYVPRDLSTAYDLMTGLALPGFVAKKLFNRWILVPGLRPLYAGAIARILEALRKSLNRGDGCLFFYALKKQIT